MNESIPTSGKDTFLWQYYPKITMEHFRLNNIDLTMEEIHPALFLILTKVIRWYVEQIFAYIVTFEFFLVARMNPLKLHSILMRLCTFRGLSMILLFKTFQ